VSKSETEKLAGTVNGAPRATLGVVDSPPRYKPPGAVRLAVHTIGVGEAIRRCAEHHRHLPRVAGGLVGLVVVRRDTRWPVAWGLIGRPVARELQVGGWVEYSRGIVPDGAPPGCASALLGAAARWARKLGQPLVTYTLATEPGTSLRAAGWVEVVSRHDRRGPRQWSSPSRTRTLRLGVVADPKRRWVSPASLPAALARGWVPAAPAAPGRGAAMMAAGEVGPCTLPLLVATGLSDPPAAPAADPQGGTP